MPLFKNRRIANLADFVAVLDDIRTDRITWFRGQSRAKYGLVPSLARLKGDWLGNELVLLKRWQQNAVALIPQVDRSNWDWLLLMQHYGVPTRLLDWTENPMAALYFAVNPADGVDPRSNGVVWVLDPVALNESESIVLAANDIPVLGLDPVLRPYATEDIADAPTSRGPVAVLAKRMFPRLVAQAGVFTIAHRDPTPIEQIRSGAFVGRIIIPRAARSGIARELKDIGVTRLSLFPELESVAAFAKDFIK